MNRMKFAYIKHFIKSSSYRLLEITIVLSSVTNIIIFSFFFSSVSQNLYYRVMSLNEYSRMSCRHHSDNIILDDKYYIIKNANEQFK